MYANMSHGFLDMVSSSVSLFTPPMLRSHHVFPANMSGMHIHVSDEGWVRLFGNRVPVPVKELRQPKNFVSDASVTIIGKTGFAFQNVKVLIPFRKFGPFLGQAEGDKIDAIHLGAKHFVRLSGNLDGCDMVRVVGSVGEIMVPFIDPIMHLHCGPRDTIYKTGDVIEVAMINHGKRTMTVGGVVVRVAQDGVPEFHFNKTQFSTFFPDSQKGEEGSCEIIGFDVNHDFARIVH